MTENDYLFREFISKEAGGDDGDGGGGIIFPEHPSPILHAPRDNIPRKGKPSLRHSDVTASVGDRSEGT